MPVMDSVVYVDKHPQPSTDAKLPTALSDFLEASTWRTHVSFFNTTKLAINTLPCNFGASEMVLSVGRINEDGDYGPVGGDLSSWKAYNRPYLKFDLNALWQGL